MRSLHEQSLRLQPIGQQLVHATLATNQQHLSSWTCVSMAHDARAMLLDQPVRLQSDCLITVAAAQGGAYSLLVLG